MLSKRGLCAVHSLKSSSIREICCCAIQYVPHARVRMPKDTPEREGGLGGRERERQRHTERQTNSERDHRRTGLDQTSPESDALFSVSCIQSAYRCRGRDVYSLWVNDTI